MPNNGCLHALIEDQARRTPHAPAVSFEGKILTYCQLERRASRLAEELKRLGARPDGAVGLFVERSLDMIVGMLGILKAGAAYLPLDTSYPDERLAFMLSDAAVRIVLTQSSLEAKLPASAAQLVRLDTFAWRSAEPLTETESPVRPEHLAYVIYTSGSTGRPKGVCVEHRNIVSYVRAVSERLALEPGMHHATVSTIAADLGNTVIFPALATGGCLHIISQERAENGAMLAEYFARERIDVLKIVPSHLAALQSTNNPERVMPRRRLIFGGEASRLERIAQLKALAPSCEIFNHYGPTETTVGVLTYQVGRELPTTRSGTLPLGRPLANSRVYVLDSNGKPTPTGELGELWIGGSGVARGYLNRADLSAERFVPDPFSPERGARMYRSGDVARVLADGTIEFCGRVDHQIKLHGYRIELGEIEAALRGALGVREAVVLARDDEGGDKRLVAFVAATSGASITATALREHLKARLPHYMVPSAFVVMAELPLTANGKIDRQALAALPAHKNERAQATIAPLTQTERILAEIWGGLLKKEPIGAHDDVFDLGAHSLLAMKALAKIREVFDVSLSLRNLFEHPTIAGLAQAIDALLWVTQPKTAADSVRGREEIVL